MKLYFIGADHEVTGSCHILETGGQYIMLDYGMEQGRDYYQNAELPVKPSDISCVILSHAHMDHSGMLPYLYKNGFQGPIYTTRVTRDLCQIMLQDSAHIQESETEWKNRKARRAGRPEVEPLYTVQDALDVMKQFVSLEYNQIFDPIPGVRAHLEDVGHLLGSASIHLLIQEGESMRSLAFSGDIGNVNQPIIRDPGFLKPTDYVIMESTYGNRVHGTPPDYIEPLIRLMKETFDKGGNLVIPCFAVGRTQQMLYYLRCIVQEKLVTVPGGFSVYVDSPLAVEATKIFEQDVFGYFDEDAMELIHQGIHPIRFEGLRLSVTSDESKMINFDNSPKVILSASGMCEAGRIRHHLKHNLWRPESTILFVGYQAEGTIGRKLLEGAQEVKLFGETIEVRARIERLEGVSGHADKNGLIRWLTSMNEKPEKAFIVHGEDAVCDEFAACLRDEHGIYAETPYSGDIFDLILNQWEYRSTPVRITRPEPEENPEPEKTDKSAVIREKRLEKGDSPMYRKLWEQGQRLISIIEKNRKRNDKELERLTKQLKRFCDKWEL